MSRLASYKKKKMTYIRAVFGINVYFIGQMYISKGITSVIINTTTTTTTIEIEISEIFQRMK